MCPDAEVTTEPRVLILLREKAAWESEVRECGRLVLEVVVIARARSPLLSPLSLHGNTRVSDYGPSYKNVGWNAWKPSFLPLSHNRLQRASSLPFLKTPATQEGSTEVIHEGIYTHKVIF
ncbi:hypothetical protein Pcinc_010742 [Petrolisthes cinctipes]|uniref:Uncharacterized protein n=1 Tax=Petrolisthes cinctipes TaxID=88211 RepID=A0AAE1G2P1_PETCI|nr:hypothetical protein Pcinc_010742 [Petrolisthes cinctipes]